MKSRSLTTWIVAALFIGVIVGFALNKLATPGFNQQYSADISVVTDIFLRLIKMIIAPLILSTLVVGIAKMGDARTLGRVFSKTLFYLSALLLFPSLSGW